MNDAEQKLANDLLGAGAFPGGVPLLIHDKPEMIATTKDMPLSSTYNV